VLSFLVGVVLFSAVYLLPLYFGFVKGISAFQIGLITLVMGAAQIIAAPLTVALDKYLDARMLTTVGFALFAIGLAGNGFMAVDSNADDVFWPQIIRGAAIALCILPPIRFALAPVPVDKVNDASGLFNLVRNVGGALGIALTDTILFSRTPLHGEAILALVVADPQRAAQVLQVPLDELPDLSDPTEMLNVSDLIEAASLTLAVNEVWFTLSAIAVLALPVLWLAGPLPSSDPNYVANGK
jgi:MFS transporter, DHA2 family, multidrug resistance protein